MIQDTQRSFYIKTLNKDSNKIILFLTLLCNIWNFLVSLMLLRSSDTVVTLVKSYVKLSLSVGQNISYVCEFSEEKDKLTILKSSH